MRQSNDCRNCKGSKERPALLEPLIIRDRAPMADHFDGRSVVIAPVQRQAQRTSAAALHDAASESRNRMSQGPLLRNGVLVPTEAQPSLMRMHTQGSSSLRRTRQMGSRVMHAGLQSPTSGGETDPPWAHPPGWPVLPHGWEYDPACPPFFVRDKDGNCYHPPETPIPSPNPRPRPAPVPTPVPDDDLLLLFAFRDIVLRQGGPEEACKWVYDELEYIEERLDDQVETIERRRRHAREYENNGLFDLAEGANDDVNEALLLWEGYDARLTYFSKMYRLFCR